MSTKKGRNCYYTAIPSLLLLHRTTHTERNLRRQLFQGRQRGVLNCRIGQPFYTVKGTDGGNHSTGIVIQRHRNTAVADLAFLVVQRISLLPDLFQLLLQSLAVRDGLVGEADLSFLVQDPL